MSYEAHRPNWRTSTSNTRDETEKRSLSMAGPIDLLAAKIAILGLINAIPEQPILNEFNQSAGGQHLQSSRAISYQHEASITQNLAFVCAYSSDPLHVLAVCIEEGRNSLTIRIAANSGKHERLLDELKPVTWILQNEANGVNRSTNQEACLKAVVALNQPRILSRIRSQHAMAGRSKSKTPLLRRLVTARELLSKSSIPQPHVQSLTDKIADLQRQFEALEEMKINKARSSHGLTHILGIIKGCHDIIRHHEKAFKDIPYTPGAWSGNATEALVDRLRKIGHYLKSSEELLRAARRYSSFSLIAVEFVDLQQQGRSLLQDAATPADSMIRIIDASCTQETFARISNRRRESISATKDQISSRLGKKTRLHAEIQLVLYYEQTPQLLRARVICSSKSACYLCQLFINLHGQYHVPSSHGRLYDTWKWPVRSESLHGQTATSISQRVLPGFHEAIDCKIQECLKVKLLPRIDPFESRVHLLHSMTPSILSTNSRNSYTATEAVRSHQTQKGALLSPSKDTINTNSGSSQDTNSSTSTTRPLAALASSTPTHETDTSATRATSRNTDDPTLSPKIIPKHSIPNIPSLSKKTQAPDMSTKKALVAKPQAPDLPTKKAQVAISTPPSPPPPVLNIGDITHHIFDTNNQTLRVQAPGLHVTLECAPQASGKSLPLEVECLALPADPGFLSECVDMDERNWKEKLAPEDVLFLEEGLRLRRRGVVVRIRVVGRKE
ncbi:hypothetical protein BCR34DRAFT_595721 [Clohesyomyces aquaticus]|uniref:Uncharacterized protein n=1 Tax=Clohesyomyces aquaticus TaxID=1231657 RepID=A0A1Y2A9V5_9PLEO|nr:hypothetical protein BCR34DRAFT_595721 [Clohesyomyces aquaticus]